MITSAALSAQRAEGERRQAELQKSRQPAATPLHEQARWHIAASGTDAPTADPDNDWDDEDQDEKDDVALPEGVKASRLPGHADDGPQAYKPPKANAFPDSLRHVGARVVQGEHITHVDLQAVTPEPLATLHTIGPDGSGSSIHSDQGTAQVQSLSQQDASASGKLPGSPSNSPKRPGYHQAEANRVQSRDKSPAVMHPPGSGL